MESMNTPQNTYLKRQVINSTMLTTFQKIGMEGIQRTLSLTATADIGRMEKLFLQ